MAEMLHKLVPGARPWLQKRWQRFNEFRYAFALVWRAAPRWVAVSLSISVLQGFLPALIVYLTAVTINRIIEITSESNGLVDFVGLVPLLMLNGIVLLLEQEFQNIQSYLILVIGEYNRANLHELVFRKAVSLDLEYFDTLEYHDQLQRATADSVGAPIQMLQAVNTLIRSLLAVLTMGALLIAYAWWLPVALFVGILPVLITNMRYNREIYDWYRKNAINRRRLNYYSWLMTVTDAAAEIRLFDLGEHFVSVSKKLREQLRDEHLALSRSYFMKSQWISDLIGMVVLSGLLLWMVNGAIKGLYSWGSLAAYYQVINQGRRILRSLAGSLSDVRNQNLALGEIRKFLQLEPKITDQAQAKETHPGLQQSIQFTDVSFAYPGSQEFVLNNFNLSIPAGKIVAIVGENGAGKSTLIKLLCRLYNPNIGQVAWDGVDLREMQITDLRRRITVLFQRYISYHESATMNIAMGDLNLQEDSQRIKKAAEDAQADEIIEKLPEGYETVLGKWFGCTDLSGGEWQRIALARAFLRQADLIILDEPTSAMDTWSEAAWMERFRDLVSGVAALVVTHRFSMAMQADVIHVMSEGRIIESGTHAELLDLNGLYAQSWKYQMKERK